MSWYNSLSGLEQVFFLSAVIGGGLFIVWMILQFVGGDFDSDIDTDLDLDTDVHSDVSGEADLSFKILSFQGLSSFLTMFGLVGLAVMRESDHGSVIALAAGGGAGFGTAWIVGRLFAFFNNMQASGTMDMQAAVGEEGSVYLRIPDSGVGKVRITIQDRLKVFEAKAYDDKEIPSDARVKVVRVLDGNTLVVQTI